jgi:phage recombination protein Bet
MAARLNVEPQKLFSALAATVFKDANNEQMLALVVVANQYKLNPFLRQIYAFPDKRGGIVPVVGIDGWTAIVTSQDAFNGTTFQYEDGEDGKPYSCTCKMHVKEREHCVEVTEFYSECFRPTDPWRTMPRRMLRHKAYMQAARLAFGLGGIYDEDEARDVAAGVIIASGGQDVKLDTNAGAGKSKTQAVVEQMQQQNRAPTTTESQSSEQQTPSTDTSAPAAGEQAQANAVLSWEQLAEKGITAVIESDGIAVQNDRGETLRPDGQWSDKYSSWTVQPGGKEQDLLAREMAMKSLATPAPAVAAPQQTQTAQPVPNRTRPRNTPPRA